MFEAESRWRVVPDAERRTLFDAYVAELDRKEKEAARNERRVHMEQLFEILKTHPGVTWSTPWRRVQDMLAANPHFQGLSKLDRAIVFEGMCRCGHFFTHLSFSYRWWTVC